MAGRRQETWIGTSLRWIIIIIAIVFAYRCFINFVNPKCTDVTDMVGMKTEELEKRLQLSMTRNSNMSKKINQYSGGKVSVDSVGGIGVVYIDGKHVGLHIDSNKYSMFGLYMGDPGYIVEDNITYEYESSFQVLDDMVEGHSTAEFYYNKRRGDCLVVIFNDYTDRIVALTYFNDLDKVTERLSGI